MSARRRARSWVAEAGVLVLFVAWAALVTWPLAANLATHVAGDLGDPLEYVWLIGWGAHAIVEQPRALFDSNMFFPLENTLVFSENLLGLAIPLAPLTRVSANPVLATNVGILASLAVASFGVRRLVLALGGAPLAALLAGLAYAVAPHRVVSITHVHVLAIHLLPFALVALVRVVQRPTVRRAVVLAALVGAQFWTSMTGGTMTLLAVAAGGLWWLLVARRGGLRPVAVAAAACVAGLALASPVLVTYVRTMDRHPEYTHPEVELIDNSATPGAYLYPHDGGTLVRGVYDELQEEFAPARSAHEKTLFPGLFLSLAVVVGLVATAVHALRRDPTRAPRGGAPPAPVLLTTLVGAVGFMLSLGPYWGARAGGLTLPFGIISNLVSGLSRVPARFGALVIVALAVAAGVGMSRLPRRALHGTATLGLVVLLAEAWPAALPTSRVPEVTEAHRGLADTERTLLVLPTAQWIGPPGAVDIASVLREPRILWLSTAHYRPMVNGYGAFLPQAYVDITMGVQAFPSASSIALLHRLGVDTVVIERDLAAGTPWQDAYDSLRGWPGVRLVDEAGHTAVFDVTRATPVRR